MASQKPSEEPQVEKCELRATEETELDHCFHDEPAWTKWIPGGYARSRCIKSSGKRMDVAILALAGTCILFFGYDAAVMSLVNINPDYLEHIGADQGTANDAAKVGGLLSFWFLGFCIGAVLCAMYADALGRLKSMQLGCCWGVLGAVILAAGVNLTSLAFGRIISGIGCGHLNAMAPIWTSELAGYNRRGAFVAIQFSFAIIGAAMVYWMEYACLKIQSLSFAWRFPLGFQAFPLALILVAAPFYPESPRHLARTRRFEEAKEILRQCRPNPTEESIDLELQEIMEAIRIEAKESAHSFISMIWKSDRLHTRRRVALAMGVQAMNKFSGPDVVAAFGPAVFALSGFTGNMPAILGGLNLLTYACAVVLASRSVERFGRRRLMMFGSLAMGTTLILTGILSSRVYALAETDPRASKRYGCGVVFLVFAYTVSFGSSWIVCSWVYPTEVFPLATRAKGVSLALIAFAVSGGVINEIIPYIIKAAGFWVFIMFGLLNLLQIIPVWLFYIETSDRHLEDLDILFASDSPLAYKAEKEFNAKKLALGFLRPEESSTVVEA